jgi:hypothetical protein
METINVKVPKYQKTFGGQSYVKRNRFVPDMQAAINCPAYTPIKSKNIKLLKTRQSRNISRFGNSYIRPSQLRYVPYQNEELINPMTWFTNQHQQPWYTVIPVGVYRPEEVRVKLNPLCHLLVIKTVPSMQRTPLFRQIITLPKSINFDLLRVQLNQRGELLVIAPFKYTQGCPSFEQGQTLFVPPYFQEEDLKWTEVPITIYQMISSSVLNKPRQQQTPFYPYGGESESSTTTTSSDTDSSTTTTDTETESDTDTESGSESESEYQYQGQYPGGYSGKLPMNQECVQKYFTLLKKIFYPNIVTVKFVPMETTKYTKSQEYQPMQLLLDIKFVEFQSQNIQVHIRGNMLIVEVKKTTTKYFHREFMIPKWLDVNHLVYRVLPNGVLRIKVPLLMKYLGYTSYPQSYRQSYPYGYSKTYPQVGLPQICSHTNCHTLFTKPFQGQQTKWQVPQRYL